MGFYLWLDQDTAWAQGTYEYRPLGTAIVSRTDIFTRADFDNRRRRVPPKSARFQGQFASIGHLNQTLKKRARTAPLP